jgi:poly-gamma-glutamate capsule biosynthesis protein CapA/YwtB (metallophosphatase superfamily)
MDRLSAVVLIVFFLILSSTDGSWAVNQNRPIQVTAVGDIMMGSTYPTPILPPEDGQSLFRQVKSTLKGGDIVFGNLEGPLTDSGLATKCGKNQSHPNMCFEFRMPTRYAKHLSEAGFTVLNIINNHTLDFGADGLNNTIKTLKAEELTAIGGTNVGFLNVRGRRVALAGFSYSESHEWPSIMSIGKIIEIVTNIKKDNDIVIVSFHGGSEGAMAQHVTDTIETLAGETRGNVIKFARSAVDAGADLVIGHGPHVLRALELYKGKLIAYSLGNFATYGRFNTRGPSGISAILTVDMDERTGDFVAGQVVPIRLREGGIPFPDEEQESLRMVRELSTIDVPSSLFLSEGGYLYPGRSSK